MAKKPKEKWRREKEKHGEVLGEAGEGREPPGLGGFGYPEGQGPSQQGAGTSQKVELLFNMCPRESGCSYRNYC